MNKDDYLINLDWKAFHLRMDSLEALSVDERLDKYRQVVHEVEAEILRRTGDPLIRNWFRKIDSKGKADAIDELFSFRYFTLSKMFQIHCSDSEVKRIEDINDKLYKLTSDMFQQARSTCHNVNTMLKQLDCDDCWFEASLRFKGGYKEYNEEDILSLDEDDFYGSDFKRMILILAFLDVEYKGDVEIMGTITTLTEDNELVVEGSGDTDILKSNLDNGTTWAEGWLHHPKLEHIVFCYAMHALVTHNNYCIPDAMHLNTFETRVEINFSKVINNQIKNL
jgi:hypothetical protein